MAEASLTWIDASERTPDDDSLVVVWVSRAGVSSKSLSDFFTPVAGHALVTARYGTTYIDRMFDRDPPRRWLVIPGKDEFKAGVVRWWAHFNLPPGIERASGNESQHFETPVAARISEVNAQLREALRGYIGEPVTPATMDKLVAETNETLTKILPDHTGNLVVAGDGDKITISFTVPGELLEPVPPADEPERQEDVPC